MPKFFYLEKTLPLPLPLEIEWCPPPPPPPPPPPKSVSSELVMEMIKEFLLSITLTNLVPDSADEELDEMVRLLLCVDWGRSLPLIAPVTPVVRSRLVTDTVSISLSETRVTRVYWLSLTCRDVLGEGPVSWPRNTPLSDDVVLSCLLSRGAPPDSNESLTCRVIILVWCILSNSRKSHWKKLNSITCSLHSVQSLDWPHCPVNTAWVDYQSRHGINGVSSPGHWWLLPKCSQLWIEFSLL